MLQNGRLQIGKTSLCIPQPSRSLFIHIICKCYAEKGALSLCKMPVASDTYGMMTLLPTPPCHPRHGPLAFHLLEFARFLIKALLYQDNRYFRCRHSLDLSEASECEVAKVAFPLYFGDIAAGRGKVGKGFRNTKKGEIADRFW